jgi:hypothetical protein
MESSTRGGEVPVPIFQGNNFQVWKFRIMSLLESRNLSGVISDPIPEVLTEEWNTKNRKAKAVLIAGLKDEHISYAEDARYARSILENLSRVFEQKRSNWQVDAEKETTGIEVG